MNGLQTPITDRLPIDRDELGAWAVAGLLVASMLLPERLGGSLLIAVVTISAVAMLPRLHGGSDADGLATARTAYVEGDLSLDEFEQRVELALDGRAVEIRDRVERIGGIGPETSASLAMHFDSLAALEAASRDELLAVYGVGPATAETIAQHLGGHQ